MTEERILLFADWDGVLANSFFDNAVPKEYRQHLFREGAGLDSLSIESFGLLNRLFYEHDNLHMVCSSVWRKKGRSVVENSLKVAHERLCAATGIADLPYAIRFNDIEGELESWRTEPSWEADHPRGDGVRQYLAAYGVQGQHYIILDDDSDFHEEQKPHFVKTQGQRGFGLLEFIALKDKINAILHPSAEHRISPFAGGPSGTDV